MKKTSKNLGFVRIIGGLHRGKKLSFPAIEGLRPTPDRVRETLFNWLMHDIRGAHCLDVFAGSGALGFEAYSRGASRVMLIEQSTLAFGSLNLHAESLSKEAIAVQQADALVLLKQLQDSMSFDIVFVDPPFAKVDLYPSILALLENSPLLKTGRLLYLEAPQTLVMNEDKWETIKLKQTGLVVYALYRKKT